MEIEEIESLYKIESIEIAISDGLVFMELIPNKHEERPPIRICLASDDSAKLSTQLWSASVASESDNWKESVEKFKNRRVN